MNPLFCSTGGRFDIALPDSDAARFLSDIKDKSSAFFDMLALVKTERSEFSRVEDRDRIFEAVRSIDGGFCTVDRMVFKAMEAWFVRRLQAQVESEQEQGHDAAAAEWQRVLGALLCDKSDFKAAMAPLELSHATLTREFGPDDPRTLQSLRALAECIHENGDVTKAQSLHQTCFDLRLRVLGAEHRDTLESMSDVAQGLENLGQYARALEMFQTCWETHKRRNGEERRETMGALFQMAACYRSMGQFQRALPMLEANADMSKRLKGEDHPDTIAAVYEVADTLSEMCPRVTETRKFN